MSESGTEHELHLQPVTYEEACAFVDRHHSTHDPPQGWKFGIGVNDGEQVVGVAIVGRPVSKHRQDGVTLEVTRCATDETRNVASKLYAAAWRAAKNMGYHRLITYTLADSEEGTPLRAVNGYEVLHERNKGGDWDSPSRRRVDTSPEEQKTIWENCREPETVIEIETPDDEEDDDTEQQELVTDGGTEQCERCGGEGEVLGPGPDVHQCPECGAGQGQTSAEQWDPAEDPHACSLCGQPLSTIEQIENGEHCDGCLREYGFVEVEHV